MTEKLIRNEQEAIECLKKNKPTSGYYMLQESVEMAIQALEKQVPKKPIELDTWGEYYKCPTCGKYAVDENGGKYKFCPNCGTEFDWSEE